MQTFTRLSRQMSAEVLGPLDSRSWVNNCLIWFGMRQRTSSFIHARKCRKVYLSIIANQKAIISHPLILVL